MNIIESLRENKQMSKWTIYWPFAFVILHFSVFRTHFTQESLTGLLGLVLIPFITQKISHRINCSIYHILSFVSVGLYFVIPSSIVAFIGVWWCILSIVELTIGKLNPLAFFLPLFFSRILRHLMSVFAFPLRIKLTQLASKTFVFFGADITSQGSEIVFKGDSFFVDTACVGLNLVSTSFILLFFILALKERKLKQYHSFVQVLMFISLNFLLIVFSNYLRIVSLIVFQSPPDTVSHELIGIASLVFFNIVPLWLISNKIKPKIIANDSQKKVTPFHRIAAAVPIVLLFVVCQISQSDKVKLPENTFTGWENIYEHVYKKKNKNVTSFIKQQNPLSITNHNPLICWRGSGYQIHSEQVIEVGSRKIYLATLQKDKESLKTAWWYESESKTTIHEVEWRKEALFHQSIYYLVNVTAPSQEELINFLCFKHKFIE